MVEFGKLNTSFLHNGSRQSSRLREQFVGPVLGIGFGRHADEWLGGARSEKESAVVEIGSEAVDICHPVLTSRTRGPVTVNHPRFLLTSKDSRPVE